MTPISLMMKTLLKIELKNLLGELIQSRLKIALTTKTTFKAMQVHHRHKTTLATTILQEEAYHW